jgi:outer membrane protein OmpA-like peptidoglycan-associated protein
MKKLLLLSLTITLSFCGFSQRYYGIANSNYAGINGLYINPANVADNRMLMDFQFFSVNAAVNQNYGYSKSFKALFDSATNGNDINFTKSSRTSNIGFNVLFEGRGPSFMMQVGKKTGIGLLTRGRIVGSGTGINTDYFTFINDGIKGVKLPNGTTFNSGNVNTNINMFTEIGLVYGREILNKEKNYLKGGIVVKRYNGLGFASARVNNFSVKLIDTATSKVNFNGEINGSGNGDFNFDNFSVGDAFFNGSGSGLGFDIGAVYEHRIGSEDEDGNKITSTSRAENKYKYKIGFAIQDIGSMKYKASANNENYFLKTNNITVSSVDTASLAFDDLETYFKSIGGVYTKDNNATKIKAPTVVTLYGDYKFTKHFYVNALFTGGLVGNNSAGTRTPFQAVVTPRFEGKFLDAGLPISYNGLSKDVKVGLGLRLGLIYIGSDDLIGSVTGISKVTSMNVYAGLHAAIPYKKAKKKKDSDDEETVFTPPVVKADAPKVEEPKDTDNDGIIDDKDKCPAVFGMKKYDGCPIPDTDDDGINDEEDKCPNEKGFARYQGCPIPDTDGDGVNDEDDKCPAVKGLATNEGCPVIEAQVIKKLNFAAQAIQFEVGKDIIKPISFKQLDEVVKILNEYADYNLNIDGHTDNTGKAASNQALSEKRANAVKNYFVQKGIDEARLTATGYGDSKPLAPNTSAANKAKNRRVEMSMKIN